MKSTVIATGRSRRSLRDPLVKCSPRATIPVAIATTTKSTSVRARRAMHVVLRTMPLSKASLACR